MTNEQMDKYEELSTAVDQAHDNLSDVVAQLVGMQIREDETVGYYVIRVDRVREAIAIYRRRLEEAKANKRDFVMREFVNA
jgi:maltodextrin utilization protein YvdJ